MLLGCGSSGGGASFVGPLDAYASGLIDCHSLYKRLLTSHTGQLFQVRRSSDDDELAIMPLANGFFDVATLLSFCAGTNGFVVSVAGQLNGYDLIQPVADDQRRIVNAGALESYPDGTPCMKVTVAGSQGYYTDLFGAITSASASVFAVGSVTAPASYSAVGSLVTDTGWDYYGNACGLASQYTNTRITLLQDANAAVDLTFGSKYSWCASINGTVARIRQGASTNTQPYVNGISSVQRILAAGCASVGYYYSGAGCGWQSQAAYSSDKSADQLTIMGILEAEA